ncbi:MAG: UPF0158 family protein [Acetobacteraceae bacterium]|nr:UPF0158 family protein [Acetobacteraceae bacterium]
MEQRAKPLQVDAMELRLAFEFVSGATPHANGAYICIETGKIYWTSSMFDVPEPVPDDVEDPDRYISVPHKNDLDLGRALALSFIEQALPDEYDEVWEFFHRRGAYGHFKRLLESRRQLEQWYEYENSMTDEALLRWCEENGLQLVSA